MLFFETDGEKVGFKVAFEDVKGFRLSDVWRERVPRISDKDLSIIPKIQVQS